MRAQFIYTFYGAESVYERVNDLGEILSYIPNADSSLVTIVVKTDNIDGCVSLYKETQRIKQLNLWK